MVAYCNDCKRYVNQYCEICDTNFGVKVCERFGCGGRMLCPICGGNNLGDKRESVSNSYDFKKERDRLYQPKGNRAASDIEAKYFAEKKKSDSKTTFVSSPSESSRHCPLCGYALNDDWKFCPECGVSLIKK